MFTHKGMWISFLEFEEMDFSSKEAFAKDCTLIIENCIELGLNTLTVHVRPFADALYQSHVFPSSHLVTGIQGAPLPFDPLEIFIALAHKRNMKFEAWINPYRVISPARPITLSKDHIATTWLKEDENHLKQRVLPWEKGLYLNPASKDVQKLIVEGIRELITYYPIDSIQFDDYFYPTTSPLFDKPWWEENISQENLSLWRKEQVSILMKKVYTEIKNRNPQVSFGVSPQGEATINREELYCDFDLWQREEGFIDYIMPQLYWGFHHEDQNSSRHFDSSLKEWLTMPRHKKVALYIGLAPYLIGEGDGYSAHQQEWKSGQQMAQMVKQLELNHIQGFCLFRYHSLFSYTTSPWEKEILKERKNLRISLHQ